MSFVPFLGMKGCLLEAGCGWGGPRWKNVLLGQHYPSMWHRGPDLEWKTGLELNLIQKSPVMPTSARVPLRRTGIDAVAKLN